MGFMQGWAGKGFMGLTLVLPLLQVNSSLIVAYGAAFMGVSSSSDITVTSLTVFGSSEVVTPLARDWVLDDSELVSASSSTKEGELETLPLHTEPSFVEDARSPVSVRVTVRVVQLS